MARSATIDEDELIARLTRVFRDIGYAGASLALLSEATGLKRASLYHRFPGGKEQMAREVLERAKEWLETHVLAPLDSNEPPEKRIDAMIANLDDFYAGGKEACLLNLLASGRGGEGQFREIVAQAFERWITALAGTLREMGFDEETAYRRARLAVALVEGSLVVARGTGDTAPFRDCLVSLRTEVLVPIAGD